MKTYDIYKSQVCAYKKKKSQKKKIIFVAKLVKEIVMHL